MVKIFIGNLARGEEGGLAVTNRDLRPLFELYGTVTECEVMSDQGYGFVHISNHKAAMRAINELNGIHVVGRRIRVELSTGNTSPKSTKTGPVKVQTKLFAIREVASQTSLSARADQLDQVSKGAIKKTNVCVGNEEKRETDMSAFECLDCGVKTTSCFLLETHLNTEEHWEKIKQMKVERKEIKGVVGDRRDTWCDVCSVRVKLELMERHKEEELHLVMLDQCSRQGDWVMVGEKKIPFQDPIDSQVTNITLNSSWEGQQVAANKLKKLQKIRSGTSGEMPNEAEREANVGFIDETNGSRPRVFILINGQLVERFPCAFCDVVCNSEKQLSQHLAAHIRRGSDSDKVKDKEGLTQEQCQGTFSKGKTNLKSPSLKSDSFSDVPHAHHISSSLQQMTQSSSLLDQLAMERKVLESQLVFCQNQMRICNQDGSDLAQTMRLLEEELEIHTKLKDLETEEIKVEGQLASSFPPHSRSQSTFSRNSSGSISSLRVSGELDVDNFSLYGKPPSAYLGCKSDGKDSVTREHLLPDDVFISDEDLDTDEETRDPFLFEAIDQDPGVRIQEEATMQKMAKSFELLKSEDHIHTVEFPGKSTTMDDKRSKLRLSEARRFLGNNS